MLTPHSTWILTCECLAAMFQNSPHPMPVWTFLLVRPALRHLHFRGCPLDESRGKDFLVEALINQVHHLFLNFLGTSTKDFYSTRGTPNSKASCSTSELIKISPMLRSCWLFFDFQTHVSSIDVQVFPFASKLQPPWLSLSKRWIALWRFHLDWTALIGLNGLWPHTSKR